MAGVAAVALSVELGAPLLLLCWLCCWADDSDGDGDDTSSTGKAPKKPVVTTLGRSRRCPARRLNSSAASLHLPGTSGESEKLPLSSHRSHEEIPRRRRSNLDPADDDARYHSAPSVIDEVIHRRDWERSTKDLYIPLRSEVELLEFRALDDDNDSLEAPKAEPESTSIISFNKSLEKITGSCKKHHTNIKSSKNRTTKEADTNEVKDTDATETGSQFFIGKAVITPKRNDKDTETRDLQNDLESSEEKMKSVYKAKDAKQTFNESIKTKDHSKYSEIHADIARMTCGERRPLAWCQVKYLEPDLEDATDRSGAVHDTLESRCSLPFVTTPLPPNSAACAPADYPADFAADSPLLATEEFWRLRTASEGAILPPAQRPQSGAFSESDVEPPGGSVGLSALLRIDRVLSSTGRWRQRDTEAKETAI